MLILIPTLSLYIQNRREPFNFSHSPQLPTANCKRKEIIIKKEESIRMTFVLTLNPLIRSSHHRPITSGFAVSLTPPAAPKHYPARDSLTFGKWVSEFRSNSLGFALSVAISLSGVGAAEGLVGVNKPELLPKEFTTVIDAAGFLSDGQEKRIAHEIADIEKYTGFKLRVLAQNYPDTPGLAIKDYWQVDDRTIVFVADPTFGNILNFNVGSLVDLDIPRSFWSRLAGKYGNMFYWKEKGEEASIEAAVMAVSSCLKEPVGTNNCAEIY